MAKKSEKSEKNGKAKDTSIPEGFTPVNSARGDGWYKPETGEAVFGELLGRFKKRKSLNNQEAWYYQVLLEKPVAGCSTKVDDETVEVDLEPGQVVNLDERSALEELSVLTESGKRWRVYARAVAKRPIPGTAQTFWEFAVGKQEIIPGKNEPKVKRATPAPAALGDGGGDEIPF